MLTHDSRDRGGRVGLRAGRLASALLASALACAALPSLAAAQPASDPPTDARGNTGNYGSGAVFDPQTNHEIAAAQGGLAADETGVEVAGVQAGADSAVVLSGPVRPFWRIVPPTTDPDRPIGPQEVQGLSAVRGSTVHAEGDLLLLDTGDGQAVVRLPDAGVPAEAVPLGALVVAVGPTSGNGILESQQVTIWPAGAP